MNARAHDDDRDDGLDENEFAGDDTYIEDDPQILDDDEDDELEENDFRGEDTYVEGVLDDEFDDEDDDGLR